MALYTLSELLQIIKDDTGLNDIPLPDQLSDNSLLERLRQSALKEFSTRYPWFKKVTFGDEWLSPDEKETRNTRTGIIYVIPKHILEGTQLLGIARIDPISTASGNDSYFPSVASYSPDQVIMTIADVQLASSIGAQMSKSMTWEMIYPNKIKLYNGWMAGKYEAELMLLHDDSLSTIPPTAMTNFRELATLDLQEYIYNPHKRIQSLEVGVGTIELKIDEWQDAGSRKRDLLKEWDQTASLDIDYIEYF